MIAGKAIHFLGELEPQMVFPLITLPAKSFFDKFTDPFWIRMVILEMNERSYAFFNSLLFGIHLRNVDIYKYSTDKFLDSYFLPS